MVSFLLEHSDSAEWRELLHLFFYTKRFFPDPQWLRKEGVNVIEFDLCGGECLIADGASAHWGVNQDDETVSLATNVLPESWLEVSTVSTCDNCGCLLRLVTRSDMSLGSRWGNGFQILVEFTDGSMEWKAATQVKSLGHDAAEFICQHESELPPVK
jgi:hypothetical protein